MQKQPNSCERKCFCKASGHNTELIVITGGPGAGKSAILEMAKKNFCSHVAVLPEAASIIFGGGFWRMKSVSAKSAAQRAIYHVQRELENLVLEDNRWALGLCDRGALDGLAYWPEEEKKFWLQVRSGLASELARYKMVVHLRTPTAELGYNFENDLRIESAEEAKIIDDKIQDIWSKHPRYFQVESSENFLTKAQQALALIESLVPSCCRLPN